MDLKVLEYIIAISEQQSISRAAEQFYLSQADLSRHLKNAEREVGARLFTRIPGGVRLTQAGIIFVNDAHAILHMAAELNDQLTAMRHQKRNLIRVMADTPFHNRFIRLVMPRFRERFPDFTLEIIACNAAQARRALLDGNAELGVFYSTLPQSNDLEYFAFASTDSFLAFPKGYCGRTDLTGLKTALEEGMFIILYPVGSTLRTIQEQQLAVHQILPSQILEGTAQSSIDHISSGQACGILLSSFCTPDIQSNLICGAPFFKVYSVIAYSPNTVLSTANQELMKIIMEEFPVA